MKDIPYYWWRVEVDAAGTIVSCEQVDAEKRGTSRVTYVRAQSRAQVIKKAADWHARHLKYQSTSAKRLAAKRRAAGHCRYCETPICDESGFLCKKHLESSREAKRRHARGESTPKKRADPVAMYEAQMATHRLRNRLSEQLPEILAKYRELDGTPGLFLDWLENEVAAREVRPLRLVSNG